MSSAPSAAGEPGPSEWSQRYRAGSMPWDLGRPHPELMARLRDLGPPATAIVPGAGRGHDAAALADAGWTVTAIDFAVVLEPVLRAALGERGRVVIGDAFAYAPEAPVHMVFDHTFFCALPPRRRGEFGRWAGQVVAHGGVVASIVFPVGRPASAGGPPHGMSVEDLGVALGHGFALEVDAPAANPAERSWSARWAVFRRT